MFSLLLPMLLPLGEAPVRGRGEGRGIKAMQKQTLPMAEPSQKADGQGAWEVSLQAASAPVV